MPTSSGRWARDYDACIECGRDDVRYNGYGLCQNCARKARRAQSKEDTVTTPPDPQNLEELLDQPADDLGEEQRPGSLHTSPVSGDGAAPPPPTDEKRGFRWPWQKDESAPKDEAAPKRTGEKRTPGIALAERSCASREPSIHGAPRISKGVSVPRPTERFVVSRRPIPG